MSSGTLSCAFPSSGLLQIVLGDGGYFWVTASEASPSPGSASPSVRLGFSSPRSTPQSQRSWPPGVPDARPGHAGVGHCDGRARRAPREFQNCSPRAPLCAQISAPNVHVLAPPSRPDRHIRGRRGAQPVVRHSPPLVECSRDRVPHHRQPGRCRDLKAEATRSCQPFDNQLGGTRSIGEISRTYACPLSCGNWTNATTQTHPAALQNPRRGFDSRRRLQPSVQVRAPRCRTMPGPQPARPWAGRIGPPTHRTRSPP